MRYGAWAGALLALGGSVAGACGGSSEDGAGGSAGADAGGAGGSGGAGGASGGGGSGAVGGTGGSAGLSGAAGVDGSVEDASLDSGDASADGPDLDAAVDAGGSEIDFDPAAVSENDAAFPVGVQAGDPTSASALLWTYYFGASSLSVRVYEPSTPGKVILYYEGPVTPSADGFVHADVSPLPAHRELHYVFLEESGGSITGRSAEGRFVTAPLPGTKPVVRFGGTSCLKNDRAPFETLALASKEKLDFFILGGDNSYNDSATSLAQYRALWTTQLGQGTFRSLLVSTAHYATWDDHEVANDYNPETINKTRLGHAIQAFFEFTPARRDPLAPNRLWRKYAWGDTLEVFVLDSRSERKPSTASGPDAEYLSKAQMAWLKDGLEKSTATFKIIVNSVPITNFPLLFDAAANDRWEGYPAQRKELLDHIAQKGISGIVFLSGDFHLGASALVESSGPSSGLREILMGPGDNTGNVLWTTLTKPQFEFRTGTSNVVYFVADPTVTPPTLEVTFVDGGGNSLFDQTYAF